MNFIQLPWTPGLTLLESSDVIVYLNLDHFQSCVVIWYLHAWDLLTRSVTLIPRCSLRNVMMSRHQSCKFLYEIEVLVPNHRWQDIQNNVRSGSQSVLLLHSMRLDSSDAFVGGINFTPLWCTWSNPLAQRHIRMANSLSAYLGVLIQWIDFAVSNLTP